MPYKLLSLAGVLLTLLFSQDLLSEGRAEDVVSVTPVSSSSGQSLLDTSKYLPESFDTIVLLNQGKVEGKLLTLDPAAITYRVQLASGGIMSIEKAHVAQVVRSKPGLEQYRKIAPDYEDTAERQWQLASWCRVQGLNNLALQHANRVVELNVDHTEARRLLGDRYVNGKWIQREELLKQKGYTRYAGSWMAIERAGLLAAQTRAKQRQHLWKMDLIQWRKLVEQGNADKAPVQLHEVSDPNAVSGIIYLLGKEENPKLQAAYIKKLGDIGSSSAINFLMFNSVFQNRFDFREACLNQVLRYRSPEMIQYYVDYLDHFDNAIICRAAFALAQLEYDSAVVPLANALVTKHIVASQRNRPYFPSEQPSGNRFNVKGPRPSSIHQTTDRFLATTQNLYSVQQVQNKQVREALIYLTQGSDFGFDSSAWKTWRLAMVAKQSPTIRGRRDE